MTTLTIEQQQALDALFSGPEQKTQTWAAPAQPTRVEAAASAGGLDFLPALLGLSPEALRAGLGRLLSDKGALERQILAWADTNPLEAAFELLAAASLAFYVAEKGANPKINSYVDAFYYIATCASVGYADIFAVTQPGRAIASLVMTVGPALAARVFDHPLPASQK
jgi:hypothetical protein